MPITTMVKPLAGAALALLVAAAQAGPVEDGFKGFIDSLRASGKDKLLQAEGGLGAGELKGARSVARTDTLPLGQDHVAIFVSSSCGSCAKAVEQLRAAASCAKGAKGLGHFACRRPATVEVLNLTTSGTARDAFALVKAKGVPAVLTSKHLINGYSDSEFKRVRKKEREAMRPEGGVSERLGA
jgi:hypothetical protein